jgi:hypothetical protein
MSRREQSQERGSALLYVLASMAIVLPAVVGLARTVTTSKLTAAIRRDETAVEDLLSQADAPIRDFLDHEARDLVLLPDARFPVVAVLDDTFDRDGKPVSLTIVTWDQCGLVPLDSARGATPLRLALPRPVVSTLDRVKRTGELPGLDWFVEDGISHISPFPPTPTIAPTKEATSLCWPTSLDGVLGAHVATHSHGKLNVSTAPIDVLEAALREDGRGGLDAIVAARSEHRQVPVPAAASHSDDHESRRIEFTSTSDCFAFRVDARVGRVRRSRWLVYQPSEGIWHCVQRLLVPNA